jgi:hypothetical protein
MFRLLIFRLLIFRLLILLEKQEPNKKRLHLLPVSRNTINDVQRKLNRASDAKNDFTD